MLQRLCGIEGVTALRLWDALLAGLARFPRFNDEVIRRALAPESEQSDRHPYVARMRDRVGPRSMMRV
jgi:hypothetical protein